MYMIGLIMEIIFRSLFICITLKIYMHIIKLKGIKNTHNNKDIV